jgi:subtilisin family serine protease
MFIFRLVLLYLISNVGYSKELPEVTGLDSIKSRYLIELRENYTLQDTESHFSAYPIITRYRHIFNGFLSELKPNEVKQLAILDGVKKIHSTHQFKPHAVQTDPHWNIDMLDQTSKRYDKTYSYRASGKGIVVYTVDSGIFAAHPEFEGRVRAGIDVSSERNTEFENVDGFGHGTHVAGLIGSKTYGVAKDVSIVGVKVFNRHGDTADTATILSGLDWIITDQATHKQPAVINMSLGGQADEVMDAAVKKLVEHGLVVVVSAGNDNYEACRFSPAREPSALTVTSIQSNGLKPIYANYGRCVKMIAPGEGIKSTWPNGKTDIWGGTSQAAPHVSGAAAIYLEDHPFATPKEIMDFLIENSIDKGIVNFPKSTPRNLLNLGWNRP